MSVYDPGNTYTFTWGTAVWGATSATWSSPGVYSESETVSASAVETLGSDVAVIDTTGIVSSVSSAQAGSSDTQYVEVPGTGLYVTVTTARLYERLPGCYRDADATASASETFGSVFDGGGSFDSGVVFDTTSETAAGGGFPLLRWLACLVDQAGYIEGLIDRFSSPTASALVDPQTADAAWLPWLGQLVGLRLPSPVPSAAAARSAITDAVTGIPPGSKASIIATVEQILEAPGTVTVTDHYNGDRWQIEVNTPASVTPTALPGQDGFVWGTSRWGESNATWDPADPIVWYLDSQGVAPAGFTIVHTTS